VILSDGEVRAALGNGSIVFTPPLEEDYLAVALTTSALDLRLGDELSFYNPIEQVAPLGLANEVVIDPAQSGVIADQGTPERA
jgi:deoxycytidine triphosphate deaminase